MADPISTSAATSTVANDFQAMKADIEKSASKAAPKAPPAVTQQAAPAVADVRQAVEILNKQLAKNNQVLGFSYDESVKSPVITVKNSESGEVIRQIPNEQVVRMAHHIDQLKGLVFNKVG